MNGTGTLNSARVNGDIASSGRAGGSNAMYSSFFVIIARMNGMGPLHIARMNGDFVRTDHARGGHAMYSLFVIIARVRGRLRRTVSGTAMYSCFFRRRPDQTHCKR